MIPLFFDRFLTLLIKRSLKRFCEEDYNNLAVVSWLARRGECGESAGRVLGGKSLLSGQKRGAFGRGKRQAGQLNVHRVNDNPSDSSPVLMMHSSLMFGDRIYSCFFYLSPPSSSFHAQFSISVFLVFLFLTCNLKDDSIRNACVLLFYG